MTKARTTIGSQPLPLCNQCLENRLTRQDRATGCVRCSTCRKADPKAKSNPDKPEANGSWWMANQGREEQHAWFARAARETERMCGSREFKSLGYRKAVDEIGRSSRGLAGGS